MDEPDETLRPVPPGRMWTAPLGSDGPWEFAGYPDEASEERLRQAFTGGTAYSGLPRRPLPPGGFADLTLRLDPCQDCRAPLVVVNDRIRGQAAFRLDDGQIVITPHLDACATRTPWGGSE